MFDFITSDTHYGHTNILKFCPSRPWDNVAEMDNGLIQNYNSVVKDHHTVLFVGDIFFCNSQMAKEILSQLKGNKILVLGNHDRSERAMYNIGFDFVCRRFDMLIARRLVTISHFPYRMPLKERLVRKLKGTYYDDRFSKRRVEDKGQWLIHGHTHAPEKQKGKQIYVGVDAWDYFPVHISKIEAIINRAGNE